MPVSSAPEGPAAGRPAPLGLAAWALLTCLQTACASGSPGVGASLGEPEWRLLASPRPEPLAGATRLAIGEVRLLGDPEWPADSPVGPGLGLTELVAAGLLRRPDVRFVERRRFAAALEAERAGAARGIGAPPAGVSPGAQVSASATWAPLTANQATIEVRLTDIETGSVIGSGRTFVPIDADPVGLGRTMVAAIVSALADHDRLPPWDDPAGPAAAGVYVRSGIPGTAVVAFMTGIEAEERWAWEPARRAYQAAASVGDFFEAEAALARAARLRLGGTLGES